MSISEKLALVQRRAQETVRQNRRVGRTGQFGLFDADELQTPAASVAALSEIEAFWLSRLSAQPMLFDEVTFADVLEETDWYEADLQQALGRLIKAGKVVNLDAASSRRTKRFLHYERGERLQLGPEAS
jgi:hypothetical protein